MHDINSYSYTSRLYEVNTVIKTAAAAASICVSVGTGNIFVSIYIMTVMTAVNIITGSFSVRRYAKIMRAPFIFIVIAAFTVCLNYSGDGIYISIESFWDMVKTAAAALAAVSSCMFLMLSSPLDDIMLLMKKIHIPHFVTEIMFLMYRYIFVLIETAESMKISAECRLGGKSLKSQLGSLGGIISNIFIISLKKAEAVQTAMESRLYNGTFYNVKRMKPPLAREMFLTGVYFFGIITVYAVSVVL